jgi:sec-independent protein translocase protein TatC
VWANDRRRARQHPDPYAGLADDELSPVDLEDADIGNDMFS